MSPAVGDAVAYRAIAGDVYEAEVTAVHGQDPRFVSRRVDVEVTIPGVAERFTLTGVAWHEDPNEQMPGARPRTAPVPPQP